MLDAAKAALVAAIIIVVAVLVALIRIRVVARPRKLRSARVPEITRGPHP